MRILSVTAQKTDSTGSGVFLSELVSGFSKLSHTQAVICGAVREDAIRFPADVRLFPVHYQSDALPFPVCGMSDQMPYESTRYCDMTPEMTAQFHEAFRDAVIRAVAEFQPDVILCHHLYYLTALVRQLCPDIPVYGQCHGSDLRQIRKNSWQRSFIIRQISCLDGIFALHDRQKQDICHLFGAAQDRVRVMGTGYNSDVFQCSPQLRDARDTEKVRLIFAGKLSEKKGLFSLLQAMAHLSQPETYELVLAGGSGSSEAYTALRRLAEAAPCKVSFPGKLTQRELARQMNGCDIFILPSFYEGLPLVLIEAMACGLKTVCTDLPGIRPWLDRTIPGNGTVFVEPPRFFNADEPLPEDLPAFARRLASAIETAAHSPKADPAGIRQVSWDALCQKLCDLWTGHTTTKENSHAC